MSLEELNAGGADQTREPLFGVVLETITVATNTVLLQRLETIRVQVIAYFDEYTGGYPVPENSSEWRDYLTDFETLIKTSDDVNIDIPQAFKHGNKKLPLLIGLIPQTRRQRIDYIANIQALIVDLGLDTYFGLSSHPESGSIDDGIQAPSATTDDPILSKVFEDLRIDETLQGNFKVKDGVIRVLDINRRIPHGEVLIPRMQEHYDLLRILGKK